MHLSSSNYIRDRKERVNLDHWFQRFSIFFFFFFFFEASIEYDLFEILEIAELRCTIGKNVNRFGSRIAFQLVSRTSSYAHTAYLSDESEVFHIAL